MSTDKFKNIIEGFLFASDKALSVERLIKLFPEGNQPSIGPVEEAIESIIVSFENHGIELKKIKSGYRFQVRQDTASLVSRLWDEKPAKYTRAMLETLALIVYRQPITRGEIEEIRGVGVSSYIIKTMTERNWIKVIGHRDVPGRPALYASTKEFLDYFNLSSLEELPPLSEIKDLDAIATELDPEQNAALISAIREMQNENRVEENQTASESESTDEVTDEVSMPEEVADSDDAVIVLKDDTLPPEETKTFSDLLSNLSETQEEQEESEIDETENVSEFTESESMESDAQ